ncbi:MAG: alpha/beta fold hydrolase [Pseudomonadota bacterium]
MRPVVLVGILLALFGLRAAVAAESLNMPSREWGNLSISLPDDGAGKGVAMLFTPASGPAAPDRRAAEVLVAKGFAVALVDTGALIAWASERDACLDLAGVGQWLSQTVQQRMDLPEYRPALLAGREEGAWAVHAMLAQAPDEVFAGGLSVGFMPGNPSGRALCDVDGVGPDRRVAPGTPLHGWWRVADEQRVSFEAARYARQAAAAGNQPAFSSPFPRPYPDLVAEFLEPQAREGVTGIPVVEVSRNSHAGVLVIFYSGDGGWRDIDRRIGDALARDGYAVLGIDALRYFWRKRTPDGVAADLARLIEHYRQEWGLGEVVLIGYSFGANILPFAYNRLPEQHRRQVRMVTLMSPELTTDFEIHMAGWLGQQAGGAAAMPILPEARRIDPALLLCVHGEQEGLATLCTQPGLASAEKLVLQGGHHYDGDYEALALRLIKAMLRRLPDPG